MVNDPVQMFSDFRLDTDLFSPILDRFIYDDAFGSSENRMVSTNAYISARFYLGPSLPNKNVPREHSLTAKNLDTQAFRVTVASIAA